MKLRPISEAPMDGTLILLFTLPDTEADNHAFWGHIDIGCWEWISDNDINEGGYNAWTSNYGKVEYPTHWIPIPRLD